MNSVKLYFGTTGYVNLSVSSRQNNYTPAFSLPITMEEDGATTYIINVFGAENSVYPVFKTSETSYFKFEHNNKNSPCIKVQKNQCISSFISNDVVYGLEVLNKKRQNEFEKSGGHKCKDLAVWFAVDSPVSSNIFSSQSYDECDDSHKKPITTYNFSFGDFEEDVAAMESVKATVALNNTSTDKYQTVSFVEPKVMNKRTFRFCFKNKPTMLGNLYL